MYHLLGDVISYTVYHAGAMLDMDRSLTLPIDSTRTSRCNAAICIMCHARGEMWGLPRFLPQAQAPVTRQIFFLLFFPRSKAARTTAVCALGLSFVPSFQTWAASWSIHDRAYRAIAKCRTLHLCRNSAPPPINASEVLIETRVQLSTRPVLIRTMIKAPMAPGARAR
jgi:hypothetical protein